LFVDASALVAMIVGEPDARLLTNRLELAQVRRTSPVAVFETVIAVARVLAIPVEDAEDTVDEFLKLATIRTVPVPVEAGPLAIDAFARFGKGRGHPAQLNMGDCFAYACARYFDEPLLFKGSDFPRTDIEAA
jgi:ribonuclease VapC